MPNQRQVGPETRMTFWGSRILESQGLHATASHGLTWPALAPSFHKTFSFHKTPLFNKAFLFHRAAPEHTHPTPLCLKKSASSTPQAPSTRQALAGMAWHGRHGMADKTKNKLAGRGQPWPRFERVRNNAQDPKPSLGVRNKVQVSKQSAMT